MTIYVANHGDDDKGNGTIEKPYNSLLKTLATKMREGVKIKVITGVDNVDNKSN